MFTGIITDIGRVRSVRQTDRDRRYEVETVWDTASIDLGASISHAGCCLTVTEKGVGWFAVEVSGLPGGPHPGVANLGVRPSVDQVSRPILEVHLFDFSADLYGHHLSVRFLHKLRNEVHFPDFAALKAQIAQDVRDARHFFKL